MDLVPKALTSPLGRVGAAAQNALEVARFGGLETGEEPSPYEVAAEHRVYRLRHYFPDGAAARQNGRKRSGRPPIVLVPPMMLAADVYDVSPSSTAVGVLQAGGVDPWVVDFGAPEREEGGLERNLADHVLAVSDAVDRVREMTGRDVLLGGYSQGGMFCYQTAAYRRSEGIDSVITFGSPVDTRAAIPFGLPEDLAVRGAGLLAGGMARIALPAWASRTGFRLLDPVKSVRQQIDFLLQLHDREALLPRERQRRFLNQEGWVAWPGPAMADFLQQFIAHNRMLEGGFVIRDRLVTLADIECPILTFVGEVDEIAPPVGVRAIRRAAPRADIYEIALRAGHFGLVVGSTATQRSWPAVAEWAAWRDGKAEPPEVARKVEDVDQLPEIHGDRVGYGVELVAGAGSGVARSVVSRATGAVRGVRELAAEAAQNLPRLVRLEQIQPHTRISLGLLLDEQAKRAPHDVLFLYEGRAHTHADAKRRIDNVVRGLIVTGVRQGEHVGVMMGTRPSAIAVVAALNRLGAVAVLLRPDGDPEREAELGGIDRIVSDPEHAEICTRIAPTMTFVLGGGGGQRDLGPTVEDMEQIDPDRVRLPAWYRPNPMRASEVGFILFTGEGARTRANRITNRRWALSAFGTASSAALGAGDTVYSVTPIYHPSGLMMSLGGAVAGGARIAMATRFDPATFWDEVRRYGVTVCSYTWTLLHDLVEAEPHANERHHPVRLFIGSGMPRNLWKRVEQRFAPARVLEFYASTEGEAILVNLRGAKPGALGRPLPGSAEVRVAEIDFTTNKLVQNGQGFAVPCPPDVPGALLSRADSPNTTSDVPLRAVFRRDDVWLSTGDIVRRDADGDHWLLDNVATVIHTAGGAVFTGPIRDALGELPEVDLAVAYAVECGDVEIAVAAVTLRRGRELAAADVSSALFALPPDRRPALVHVVDEIPVTTWFRPITAPLREAGIPEGGTPNAWVYDAAKDAYRPLTAAARRKLVA